MQSCLGHALAWHDSDDGNRVRDDLPRGRVPRGLLTGIYLLVGSLQGRIRPAMSRCMVNARLLLGFACLDVRLIDSFHAPMQLCSPLAFCPLQVSMCCDSALEQAKLSL